LEVNLMTRAIILLFLALVTAGLYVASRPTPLAAPADTILVNATIYTVDPGRPRAEALAIRDGRVLAVGSAAEVLAFKGTATSVLDMGRRAVVPGLHDAHGHFLGLGQSLQQLDLRGTTSAADVAARVAARVTTASPEAWIVGRGWDQNTWADTAWPTAATLDAVSPAHPVYLSRVDGHAALVNTAALNLAGITRDTPDPPGGRIIRDDEGTPTGVLVDAAMGLVSRHVPPPSATALREQIALADATCARLGLTTVHDAGVSQATARLYRTLVDDNALTTRLYVMLSPPAQDGPALPPPLIGYATHQLNVRAVKLVADGALGSRGAHLLEPYTDEPTTSGLAVTAPERLYAQTLAVVRAGYQPAIHAIGDRANRDVMNIFARIQRELPGSRALRMRNEHAQILHPTEIPRFAELDVIASMQPTHATSDMAWVPTRIGEARTRQGAYVWQTLLKAGARLASGSDFPVEQPNPMFGFHAAVTRQTLDGHPADGWMPDERLTREQALRSFTLDAAYAAHLEADLGMLRPGKLADLVVLSQDIMQVPAAAIPETTVVMTMIGGRVVHRDGL
jgi:predicted amidohydrolase YtcJ